MNLKKLFPQLVEVAIPDAFGRVKERLYLRPLTLKDQIWISERFSTNEAQDNGAEVLGRALASLDQEAILLLAHHLLIKPRRRFLFAPKYQRFEDFRKAHFGKLRSIKAIIEAYAEVIRLSSPEPTEEDKDEKKTLAQA